MTDGQLSSTPPAPSSSPRSTELPTPRPIDPPAGAPPSAVIAPAWAIPRWQAVLLLMGIATVFASNHIAARFAFNHGLNVGTAVVARSVGTAVFVALLIALLNVPLNLNAARLKRAALVGVLLTLQSVFLYSAVARMPVALALLAFNSFPILLALISWAGGQPAPHTRVAWAMAVALLGLILALDAPGVLAAISGRADANVRGLVEGTAFALAAATVFALALFLTGRWLAEVDGRVRSLVAMVTVASIVTLALLILPFFGGQGFAWPADATGWLALAILTLCYGTAFTTLFVVLPKLGMVNNVVIMNFEPVAALVLGYLILAQTVKPMQLSGAAVVICALLVAGSKK